MSLESRVMLCKQLLGLGDYFEKELFDVGPADRTEWKHCSAFSRDDVASLSSKHIGVGRVGSLDKLL